MDPLRIVFFLVTLGGSEAFTNTGYRTVKGVMKESVVREAFQDGFDRAIEQKTMESVGVSLSRTGADCVQSCNDLGVVNFIAKKAAGCLAFADSCEDCCSRLITGALRSITKLSNEQLETVILSGIPGRKLSLEMTQAAIKDYKNDTMIDVFTDIF